MASANGFASARTTYSPSVSGAQDHLELEEVVAQCEICHANGINDLVRPLKRGNWHNVCGWHKPDLRRGPRRRPHSLLSEEPGLPLVIIRIWKCRDPGTVRLKTRANDDLQYFCRKLDRAQGHLRRRPQCQAAEMALIEQPVAHGDETRQRRRSKNKRLRQAVHRHKPISKQGILERLFTLAFSGLVYPRSGKIRSWIWKLCPLREANTLSRLRPVAAIF